MKILDTNDYREISVWMHRNARPLELAIWKYEQECGCREDILEALTYYQNKDGGFGNGIEPDCWNTESSPYATMIAAGILQKAQLIENLEAAQCVLQDMLRYLESDAGCDDDGWWFAIPSNDRYPRAPWWTYSEESNKLQGMGITAGLCSFILHYADKSSVVYEKAAAYVTRMWKKASQTEDFGEMGAVGICMLLPDAAAAGLIAPEERRKLEECLTEVMNRSIERDSNKWEFYTPRPSAFIDSVHNPLYQQNKELVETELDYLIDTRNPQGVWNINWSWFDLGETYAKEFAVSENWWMAAKALEKVAFLQNFGRCSNACKG